MLVHYQSGPTTPNDRNYQHDCVATAASRVYIVCILCALMWKSGVCTGPISIPHAAVKQKYSQRKRKVLHLTYKLCFDKSCI